MEIDLTKNNLTKGDEVALIDDMTFRCYAYNRERSPNIPVEDWTIIFGDRVYQYEKRLQLGVYS